MGRSGNKKPRPCNCVLRSIFRICLNRYRSILVNQESIRTGSAVVAICFRETSGGRRGFVWSRPHEEYLADIHAVARRTIEGNERKLFLLYHLAGFEWKEVSRALGLNRGEFFHSVYRVEQKLGKAFAETEPCALFPPEEYFHTVVAGVRRVPRAEMIAFPAPLAEIAVVENVAQAAA